MRFSDSSERLQTVNCLMAMMLKAVGMTQLAEPEIQGHQKTLKTVWHAALRRAKAPYFRIYDLRSTYATRLSAGGVADEWVTELLRQGDAKVFKKYSQMKLQMKREALQKLNRQANESGRSFDTERPN